VFFVINESSDRLAATLEYVTAGIDMQNRCMAAFPDDLALGLDRLVAEHARLDWTPPLCGVLEP
jgi:acyl-CoA thioester hydrolase